MGLCVPLVIYLVLTALSLVSYILSGRVLEGPSNLISHLVVVAISAGLLYWLCSIGYIKTAWVVLLLPAIMIGFVLLTFITAVASLRTTAKISSDGASARVRTRINASSN